MDGTLKSSAEFAGALNCLHFFFCSLSLVLFLFSFSLRVNLQMLRIREFQGQEVSLPYGLKNVRTVAYLPPTLEV